MGREWEKKGGKPHSVQTEADAIRRIIYELAGWQLVESICFDADTRNERL